MRIFFKGQELLIKIQTHFLHGFDFQVSLGEVRLSYIKIQDSHITWDWDTNFN